MNTASDLKIKQIFSSIAEHYDKANTAITFNMDKAWRKKLVKLSQAPKNGNILDCATGTGALAFEFQKCMGKGGHITGIDFCENMLKKAKQKANKVPLSSGPLPPVHFQLGDVQKLDFPDNTFDISSMAYGLRNMKDPLKALKEMARVTKPTGKVLILETGGGGTPLFLRPFFYIYLSHIMPRIGALVTGHKTAYRYLQESSKNFPSQTNLLLLFKQTQCYQNFEYQRLCFGASFIYKAQPC